MIVAVSIRVCLDHEPWNHSLFVFVRIMNHGTIVQQNNRGSASEMMIIRICTCLFDSESTRDDHYRFCSCLFDSLTMEPLSSKTVGGRHVMIVTITVSVRVCLIYEPWSHCPHIIAGGTCDDRFRVFSCWFRHMVSGMNHGTISNRQIVWRGSLRLAPIIPNFYLLFPLFTLNNYSILLIK